MPSRKTAVRQAGIVRVFAERLKGVRLSKGMTQRELAEKAQVTLTYISRLEAGGAAPGIDLVERLALALGVGVTDLLPTSGNGTADERRQRVRGLFETVLPKAGPQALATLDGLLAVMAESPVLAR